MILSCLSHPEFHRRALVWLLRAMAYVALVMCGAAQSQNLSPSRNSNPQIESASAGKRVALVIGNNTYQTVGTLEKAVNDADAMGRALTAAGFKTSRVINATRNQMNAAINQFVEDVSAGGVGVVFYAGHGVQVGNQNFLIPTDLQNINREADIADQGISLQNVQDKLADAKARFVLLVIDACRDNPLPKRAGRSLGGSRGLAQAGSAEGQMVLFSAGAGQQALDKLSPRDTNPNGVFTREFLPWVNRPGVSIREAVQNVRSAVRASARSAQHEQFPALYDQVDGNFYFVPGSGASVAAAQPSPVSAPLAAPLPSAQPVPAPVAIDPAEAAYWAEVKRLDDLAAYSAYIAAYPSGRYLADAREAIAQDKRKQEAQARLAEDQAWAKAEAGATEASYSAYLRAYPNGRFAPLAKLKQERLLATLNSEAGKVFKDCADCPEMVVIPAGSFQMGGTRRDEVPVHTVMIDRAFALGRTEVTQGQWQAIMGNNPSNFTSCGLDCPVDNVSWDDAQAFIRKLNMKTRKTYRLPSEAEWEYACRAGGREKFCGSANPDAVGWYNANSNGRIHQVAQKQANAFGLFDMSGNVWEWVQDVWHVTYVGAPSDGGPWETNGDQGYRVMRGGAQDDSSEASRRVRDSQRSPKLLNGFRLARMLP